MDYTQEAKLKEACQQQANSAKCNDQYATGLAGAAQIGRALDEPARTSLRDRVEGRLNRAYRESRRVQQLEELQALLLKNPDLARILDLIDADLLRG